MPPPPDRRVNDYARALSAAERDALEQKLVARERTSSNQVVLAIFPSLEGESLEDFSVRLAQAWRVGQKGLDNGVVFLVFMAERRLRLEVGYGLEPTLTDAISASILRDVVRPRFREGRVADGLSAGLDAIDKAIAGTYAAPAAKPATGPTAFQIVLALFVAGVLASIILPAMMTSSASRRMARRGWTGGPSGWGGPVFPGGWHGGSGGGSWRGGSGGGGFSGGGGSFGGGGASGSW